MLAVIGDSANTASIGLHAACGFRFAGVLQASGWKFDRWIDTVLMQRALGPGALQPAVPAVPERQIR
jgi:phosphinothricin acetyltransferase